MKRQALLVFAIALVVAACSGGSHSVPPSSTPNNIVAGAQSVGQFHTPSPKIVQGRRATLSLDPDTDDECLTIPPGWRCIVQGAAPYTGGGYYMGIAQGQTAVCGSASTDIPNVQMTTFPTTITYPQQNCNNTITVPAGSTIGNNATYTINGSISGSCGGGNYCGNFTLTGYFEIECSLSENHCPLGQIYDNDLNEVVSGSPQPTPNTVIAEQQNPIVQWQSGTGPAPTYSIEPSPVPVWTIAGSPITAYGLGVANAPATSPTELPVTTSDLNRLTPTPFFWMLLGTDVISVTATIYGNLGAHGTETSIVSPTAAYNVQAPTNISIGATVPGAPKAIFTPSPPSIWVGLTNGGSTNPVGIKFSFGATVPTGGSGTFAATQLISSCAYFTKSGTTYYPSDNTSSLELDNSTFYANVKVQTPNTYVASDGPSTGLTPSTSISNLQLGASAQTYFVYQPSGVGAGAGKSVWDPLGYLLWSFNGATTQTSPNVWSAATGTKPNPSGKTAIGTIPTWSAVTFNGSPTYGTTNNCS